MYSRYIPKPGGGYDRRLVPDPPDAPQATGNRQQATENVEQAAGNRQKATGNSQPTAGDGVGIPFEHVPSGQYPAAPPPLAGAGSPSPPPRSPTFSSRSPPMGPPGGLLGLPGLLSRLLPRGLDTEDLLILAVLLLAMKQDGAAPAELLIAAALYLWMQ